MTISSPAERMTRVERGPTRDSAAESTSTSVVTARPALEIALLVTWRQRVTALGPPATIARSAVTRQHHVPAMQLARPGAGAPSGAAVAKCSFTPEIDLRFDGLLRCRFSARSRAMREQKHDKNHAAKDVQCVTRCWPLIRPTTINARRQIGDLLLTG